MRQTRDTVAAIKRLDQDPLTTSEPCRVDVQSPTRCGTDAELNSEAYPCFGPPFLRRNGSKMPQFARICTVCTRYHAV